MVLRFPAHDAFGEFRQHLLDIGVLVPVYASAPVPPPPPPQASIPAPEQFVQAELLPPQDSPIPPMPSTPAPPAPTFMDEVVEQCTPLSASPNDNTFSTPAAGPSTATPAGSVVFDATPNEDEMYNVFYEKLALEFFVPILQTARKQPSMPFTDGDELPFMYMVANTKPNLSLLNLKELIKYLYTSQMMERRYPRLDLEPGVRLPHLHDSEDEELVDRFNDLRFAQTNI
jgi:hypothetical protein